MTAPATPADAAVAPDGSLVHGIDIRLPPGTNGMAPKLALAYSSQAGNGPFGVGWKLVGLPTISRTSLGYGINYDGLDAYIAEGGGRLIRQGDGSYFPEVWSGAKYIPHGTCGDGPCLWVLKSGSGIDMYFGGTTTANPTADHSSRIHRSGTSGSVRVWALAKVVNTRDQLAYEVTYDRDPGGGDHYPQRVLYTTGPGLGVGKTITFATEARNDAAGTFAQSGYERWDRRINSIRIDHGTRLLREYVLTYEYGTTTGRSRIRSVQERGSAGGSLPAQVFTWDEGADYTTMARWMTAQPGTIGGESPSNQSWFEGDFSGDGRTDRCKIRNVSGFMTADCYITTESTFVHKQFCSGYDWVNPDPSSAVSQWFSGDFDGDGKSDLAKVYTDGLGLKIGVHRSTGTGFTQETWTPTPLAPFISTNASAGSSQWFAADFNADGRTDLGVVYDNNGTMNADVYLSSGRMPAAGGAGFVYRQWAVSQGGWISTNAAAGNSQWFATDFNGDGKADLAKIWNEGGLFHSDVHVSTGSGFSFQRWATAQGGWVSTNIGAGASQWFVGDFNGDGKTDLGKIWGGADVMNADVHMSTGRVFTMERWATAFPGWVPTSPSGNYSQWFSGDFNGDGKTDLSRMWNCSAGGMCMDVYPSRFGGFAMLRYATAQGGWVNTSERQWFTGDFNGDGKTDLAKFFMSTGGLAGDVHRAGGDLRPDLISRLHNGVGGATRVTYSLGLPPAAIGTGCGLEATGGGWVHGGTSGNGQICGIPNTSPRALVVRTEFDNGNTVDPGRFRAMIHMYTNGRTKPGGFDEEDYRVQNPDVAQSAYGSMPFGMEKHYTDASRAEGRFMRLRGADTGFERYEEKDEKTGGLVQMNFRQDTPFQARPSQTDRINGPVKLQEKYSYTSWTPIFGTVGINDQKKVTSTFENNVLAHTMTQTKTLD
ncbi:MAG TPA: SpvB/TcaC N-terminal domain-containing protein, partial [Polyangia bacterium]